MGASRSFSRLTDAVAACAFLLVAMTPAAADSILAGKVIDITTGRPVPGAKISIEHSGQVVGTGTSDFDGIYRVAFTSASPEDPLVTMVVAASSPDYGLATRNFQVRNGTPIDDVLELALYPVGVAECRALTDHSVIVGDFLAPVGASFADLPQHVARSLDVTLNISLQKVRLPAEFQPSFEYCDAAKPKTPRLAAGFAKALKADAFVGGNVADGPPSFTVSTFVSDAYGLFAVPVLTVSSNVNLNNPSTSAIGGETHAAVLAAVAAGLAKKGDYVAAIDVVSVAEKLVDPIPPYLADMRRDIEGNLPNTGLLGSGP